MLHVCPGDHLTVQDSKGSGYLGTKIVRMIGSKIHIIDTPLLKV